MGKGHQPPGGVNPSLLRFGRKPVILLFVGSLLFGLGAIVFREWQRSRAYEEALPQLRSELIYSGLVKFDRLTGRYPETLIELDERVWRNRDAATRYGPDGCRLTLNNYYYIYHRVNPQLATLWAVPVGARRNDAASYFFVVRRERIDRWKGAAFQPEEIRQLNLNPTLDQLALLGMTLQPPLLVGPDGRLRRPSEAEARNYMREAERAMELTEGKKGDGI